MDLPFIDAHTVPVSAAADKTWSVLVALFAGNAFTNERFAGLLGCSPSTRAGSWSNDLTGSAVAGFAVSQATAPSRLELRGQHHFSRYALVFIIDDASVTAESYAEFPGLLGRVYRAMVIGTRAHRVIVKRFLQRIAASAEASDRDEARSRL